MHPTVPTVKVSEEVIQVNREYRTRNTMVQLSIHYTDPTSQTNRRTDDITIPRADHTAWIIGSVVVRASDL